MSEMMSDERLAEIRQHTETVRSWLLAPDAPALGDLPNLELENASEAPTVALVLSTDALVLLAEVERLRAENAALWPLVEAVAAMDDTDTFLLAWDGHAVCPHCHVAQHFAGIDHTPECTVTLARALRAARQTGVQER
jgi:hypothetical protein